jgi:tetratricopeptide (TPR) repeat protein
MSKQPPTKTPQEISAEYHKTHGNTLFLRHDYRGAIAAYSTAIINNPRIPAYFTNRALCYTRLGKHGAASRDSRKAVELDRENVKGHYYLGLALTEGIWERTEKEEERARMRKSREADERVRREMGVPEVPWGEQNEEEDFFDEEVEVQGSMSEAVDELTIGG